MVSVSKRGKRPKSLKTLKMIKAGSKCVFSWLKLCHFRQSPATARKFTQTLKSFKTTLELEENSFFRSAMLVWV